MGSPIDIASATGLAVDAASNVFATWLQPNANSNTQRPTTWRAQIVIATEAVVNAIYSFNSDGSSPFATATINSGSAGGTLRISALYNFRFEARSSVYVNFRPAATTTFQMFWITESGSETSV